MTVLIVHEGMTMGKGLEMLIDQTDPTIVAGACRKACRTLLDIHLNEVCRLALQPGLNIEKPSGDVSVFSLKQYIEAFGGKVVINVDFDDGTHYGFPL